MIVLQNNTDTQKNIFIDFSKKYEYHNLRENIKQYYEQKTVNNTHDPNALLISKLIVDYPLRILNK